MSRGDAKPIIRMKSINANKSQKLVGFFDYLTQPGHQTEKDEIPEVYTNLEDDSTTAIRNFFKQYEKNFQNAMKSGKLKNNCKLLAKSMVFMLPYGMTKPEIDGYVKAITKTLPDYMTFVFAVHRGSNKMTRDSHKNLHLQGFLGIRGDGTEKFGPDVRFPLHENLILAANAYVKSIKFKIAFNPVRIRTGKTSLQFLEAEAFKSALAEGVSGNRALKTRQSELLRDSGWLIKFSQRDDFKALRLKQFCEELAFKRIKINAEKFQKKPEFDLQFMCKKSNKALVAETVSAVAAPVEIAKPTEATMEVRKLPMPFRLRTDVETFNQHAERRRRERCTLQQPEPVKPAEIISAPSPEEQLKKYLDELTKKRETNNDPNRSMGL